MKKMLKVFTLIFILVAAIGNPVLAEPTSEDVQSQTAQLQASKDQLKNAQNKRFQIEQNIEKLDNQIEDTMNQIADNKKKVIQTQADIKTAEADLLKTEEDSKSEQDIFNKRMRAIYINGTSGYLEVILEAKSFSDLYARVEALTSVINLDKKITAEIEKRQQELNIKKQNLNEQNDKLIALNKDNAIKMDKLKTSKDEQNKLIADAKKQENLYVSAVNGSQARLQETLNEIAAIRNATPKYTISRGAIPASSNAVIAYASNFLGTPYLWGGTTPAGFDCSGFTQYVYRHFGISIGRTTYDQINDGYAVSRDQLKPGDLVFYGQGGSPTHVGIYVGNGMYINSPRTGDVLKIASYDRSDYITARRVMN